MWYLRRLLRLIEEGEADPVMRKVAAYTAVWIIVLILAFFVLSLSLAE
jgi:hypothetical protein